MKAAVGQPKRRERIDHGQCDPTTGPHRNRARPTRWFRLALLTSLGGTGLLGIGALLFGTFGQLEVRVLLSTLLVGLYSVLCLGNLLTAGTRRAWVGRAGVTASSLALAIALSLTWGITDDTHHLGREFQTLALCAVLGFALMHASLLLHIAGPIRAITRATLGAVTTVAAMLAILIANLPHPLPGGYWRLLGVAAILDVIGTIFVAVPARNTR